MDASASAGAVVMAAPGAGGGEAAEARLDSVSPMKCFRILCCLSAACLGHVQQAVEEKTEFDVVLKEVPKVPPHRGTGAGLSVNEPNELHEALQLWFPM